MDTTVTIPLKDLKDSSFYVLNNEAELFDMEIRTDGANLVLKGSVDPFFLSFTDSLELVGHPYLLDHKDVSGSSSYVEHFDGDKLRHSNRFNGELSNAFTDEAEVRFFSSCS